MKPWRIILISTLVAGGLAGGGTYYFMNKRMARDKNALQLQIDDLNKKYNDTKAASAISLINDISSDWETCFDNNIGYSIKYPAGWKCVPADPGVKFQNNDGDQYGWVVAIDEYSYFRRSVEINGQSKEADSLTFEQFASNYLPGESTEKVSSVRKVQTESGIIYEVTYLGRTGLPVYSYYAYYDLGDKKYLMFILGNQEDVAVFDTMLASFKKL